jgi:hypothetical protein
MAGVTAPRFKSREAALRFYFRASELLTPNAGPGIFSPRHPPKVHDGPNITDDLIALDSCFHGMNDVQLWLLHQLYRPGAFCTRPRPLAGIFEAARSKFPKYEWTPHRIAQFKREALKIFEAHLQRERLM